jgi:hypothetical protein
MVLQSSILLLKLASTSQFFTRFSTRFGRLAASWLFVLADRGLVETSLIRGNGVILLWYLAE